MPCLCSAAAAEAAAAAAAEALKGNKQKAFDDHCTDAGPIDGDINTKQKSVDTGNMPRKETENKNIDAITRLSKKLAFWCFEVFFRFISPGEHAAGSAAH